MCGILGPVLRKRPICSLCAPPELRQQSMHGNRRRQRVYRAHSLMLVVIPRMLVVIPLMIVVIPLMLVVIPLMLVVIPRLVPLMIERAL